MCLSDLNGFAVGRPCNINNRMLEPVEHSSEARYRDLFENAIDPIFVVGPDLNYLDANRRATEVFGFTKEEFLNMRILDLIPPEQVIASKGAFSELREKGYYENFVGKMRCRDGTFRDIEVSSSAIVEDGRIIGSTDIVRDITERKRSEDALRESEIRARLLFEYNPDAAVLFDSRDATIIDTNAPANRLFMRDRYDVLGKPFGALLENDSVDCIAGILGVTVFESDTFSDVERTLTRVDGSEVVVRIHGGRLKVRGTEEVYCVFKDVTNEVQLREMWSNSLKHLIQSEKLSFIGTLVSGFAHDINNPNQLISGNVEILQRIWSDLRQTIPEVNSVRNDLVAGGLPLCQALACVPEALRDIELGSERISAIIRNVTSLARTDGPEFEDDVNVNEIVQSAVTILRHRISRTTANFEQVLIPSVPIFRGNRQKIEQVVINLMVNAMEAIQEKNSMIKIATAYDDNHNEVRITVEDHGTGMDEETLRYCNEMFYTTKAKKGGSGLGLSISSIFIREHGGRLVIESTKGKGCRVTVDLPVERLRVAEGTR